MSIPDSRYLRLVRHFFAGFLYNDLFVSPEVGLERALSQLMGLIIAPGLFYGLFAFIKYGSLPDRLREILRWEDILLFCAFAMVITGVLTVLEWGALFPDRRDYLVLSALPIPSKLIFFAKLSSVLALLIIFWAASNLGPALLFSGAVSQEGFLALARNLTAHVIATFGASACVFLFFLAVQGVLLNVLPPKWFRRVSVFAQLILVVVLALSFLLLPLILFSGIRWIQADERWIYRLPPFWFLGLYQVLIGHGGPAFSRLAALAWETLGAVAAVSALTYSVSYNRHMRRSLESLESGRSVTRPLSRAVATILGRTFLTSPVEHACFDFIRITLTRSNLQRLLLGAYVGFGLALVLVGAGVSAYTSGAHRPTPELLAVDLVLVFFVLSGMRLTFTLPAELKANWVFQATEPADKGPCLRAVWKSMLVLGAFPVLLPLFFLHGLSWGARVAVAHLAYGAALASLLTEILLIGFAKIPFTCTYLPGKANIKALWSVYLAFFVGYAYGMAKLECALLGKPVLLTAVCVGICALSLFLNSSRQRSVTRDFRLVFEDPPDPAVRTLSIGALLRQGGDAGNAHNRQSPPALAASDPSEEAAPRAAKTQ